MKTVTEAAADPIGLFKGSLTEFHSMNWSADRVDRALNVGLFVLLLADGVALLLYPDQLTAIAVVLVTGLYVLLTQFREMVA